jgi:uncharacterized metal-binding protein
MAPKNSYCCSTDTKTILACSGASNVGQLANEAAKHLDSAGEARFFCLAGVGGHVSGMVESVKGASKVLVIDGCTVACARKCMEAAGLSGYEYLVVTDLGIEKKHEFGIAQPDIDRVMARCRESLSASAPKNGDACRG